MLIMGVGSRAMLSSNLQQRVFGPISTRRTFVLALKTCTLRISTETNSNLLMQMRNFPDQIFWVGPEIAHFLVLSFLGRCDARARHLNAPVSHTLQCVSSPDLRYCPLDCTGPVDSVRWYGTGYQFLKEYMYLYFELKLQNILIIFGCSIKLTKSLWQFRNTLPGKSCHSFWHWKCKQVQCKIQPSSRKERKPMHLKSESTQFAENIPWTNLLPACFTKFLSKT